MASSSWCRETDEKINYTKLCRLLVDGGTQAVRSVFDGIHPPSSLKAILNANKITLQKLKKPKGKVLNDEQWGKLYPPSGDSPKSEDFDITLLFVLLRNICGLTAPATGWDVLPPVTDNSLEANLARTKYYRNNTIAHKPNTEINDTDFEQHWQDISSALLSLGLSQDDIDELKSDPLGKKDYNKLLYEWHMSDTHIKAQLDDLKSDLLAIKENQKDFRNVCSEANFINKLAVSDFGPEISTKCKSFHPNTRQWILDQVKSHVDSDQPHSCIMLITAGPGMGKSTIAAKICQTYKGLECLAGCHFFQFNNSTRNNPRLMLQSIARQMCDTVPGYREALEKKLESNLGSNVSELKCEELLTILFEEQLFKVKQTDSNFVVVLDALDECSYGKYELLRALEEKLSCLPSWLRFIITSRPLTDSFALYCLGSAVNIGPKDISNIKDLKLFFNFELKALYPQYDIHDNADLVQKLVEMTGGLFLVASFVIDFLKRENVASPEQVLELFPKGISSVYENYFSRLKKVLVPYISEEEMFFKMLEAVVATNNPLPKNVFYNILCLKSERDVPRQEKKAREDAVNALHWLFPVVGDHVTVFHKSVIDWLTLKEGKRVVFKVRVEDGNEVLASQCNDVLSDIRDGKKDLDKPLELTDSEKYALRFLCHLIQKHPSAAKEDKYGFFSSIYILTALKIKVFSFDSSISNGIIPSSLIDILEQMTVCFPIYSFPHFPSCHFFRPTSFGSYLAFVLQAAHANGVSEETTPNPLEALKKYRFPYFDKKSLLNRVKLLSAEPNLFKCKKGFLAVQHVSHTYLNSVTEIHKFQLDRYRKMTSFTNKRLIATSPNINFIVVAEKNGNKIERVDVTTLKVIGQYDFIHDEIESCHVFGDDQSCFIVIKGCRDNKVYVIEALTGRVCNTIQETEGSTVMDVSCQGDIVVTRTRETYAEVEKPINIKDEEIKVEPTTFTKKGKEPTKVELMKWKSPRVCSMHLDGGGLSQQVHKTKTIAGKSSEMDVNCQGDILVRSKTWGTHQEKPNVLTKKDGGNEVELMNWRVPEEVQRGEQSQRKTFRYPASRKREPKYIFTYQKLFLYHHDRALEPIPIYPLVEKACHCPYRLNDINVDKAVHISEDGRLLAYHYKDSIFIVKTSDGSLLKRWSFAGNLWESRLDILFVSESYLVIIDNSIMSVVNVETVETEHKIYLPYHVHPNGKHYLLFPEEDGRSFTLNSSHYKRSNYEVSSLVFHNLNLQGIR